MQSTDAIGEPKPRTPVRATVSCRTKLLSVEAARGVAAILVVLVHATAMLAGPHYFGKEIFGGLFRFAHAGVDFFFVLSGFIIFHVHRGDLGNPSRLLEYLRRRFVRIFPTYWVALAIFGAILVISPSKDFYERNLDVVLSSIALVPISNRAPILAVAWTLQHEILFYVLFATMFVSKRAGKIVLGAWVALIVWNILTARLSGFPAQFLFSTFNIEFFFGIGVAVLLDGRRTFHSFAMLGLGAAIFFGTGMVESFSPHFSSTSALPHLLYATGAALALLGIASAEMSGRVPAIPGWIVGLGTASYSIYLMHTTVITILQQGIRSLLRVAPLPAEVTFVVLVVMTVVICERFYFYVERPLLRWCRHALAPGRTQIA